MSMSTFVIWRMPFRCCTRWLNLLKTDFDGKWLLQFWDFHPGCDPFNHFTVDRLWNLNFIVFAGIPLVSLLARYAYQMFRFLDLLQVPRLVSSRVHRTKRQHCPPCPVPMERTDFPQFVNHSQPCLRTNTARIKTRTFNLTIAKRSAVSNPHRHRCNVSYPIA